MSTIDDATGTGKQARVGVNNRLHTHSLAATTVNVATQEGDVFNVSSELVTLTTATASALLYIENTEDDDISIVSVSVNQGNSTNGVGKATISVFINPTGGTLISVAADAQVINRRLGDGNTISMIAFKGVEGSTITGGNELVIPGARTVFESEFVIPKGASFAVNYVPPPSNTSQPVSISAVVIKNYTNFTTA